RLPRYARAADVGPDGRKRRAVRPRTYLGTDQFPEHGDHAYAIVRKGNVEEIARDPRSLRGSSVEGWVHATGRNIDGKAHERFFHHPAGGARRAVNLADHPHLEKRWCELMAN